MSNSVSDFNGLSGRAQEFFKKHIDDGDGKISSAERNKLAQYLNGTQKLPNEYESVREELENFGRNYDVQAAGKELFVEEREDVLIRGMSDKDMNQIDSIRDYDTMKAIADGTLKGYSDKQREYAKALLNNSQYARLRASEEENGVLKQENQKLLNENKELKAKIESFKTEHTKAEREKASVNEVKTQLENLSEDISSTILGSKTKLVNIVENIGSFNDEIIDCCKHQDQILEKFENGSISETTLKTAMDIDISKLEKLQKQIEEEKLQGQEELKSVEKEVEKETKSSKQQVKGDEQQDTESAPNLKKAVKLAPLVSTMHKLFSAGALAGKVAK